MAVVFSWAAASLELYCVSLACIRASSEAARWAVIDRGAALSFLCKILAWSTIVLS